MSVTEDYEAIRRRLEELAAERNLALTGSSAPVQTAEEPKVWPMWAYDPNEVS